MKTKLKEILKQFGIGSAIFSVMMAVSSFAKAEIIEGYYRGDFVTAVGFNDQAQVWIKKVNQGAAYYALILRNDGNKGGQMFRIDELEDGTQMWMQLFQSKGGLLQFGTEATYQGTTFVPKHLKTYRMRLTVTPYGETIGCKDRLEVTSETGPAWVDFPTVSQEIRKDIFSDQKGLIDSGHFSGRFVLDGKAYDGAYDLQPLIPGLALMHRVAVSRDSVDGHEVRQEITAVVAALSQPCLFGAFGRYEFVSMPQGQEICFGPVEKLAE